MSATLVRLVSGALVVAHLVFPIAAQSTLATSLFIPEADPQSLVASVIAVQDAATTYAIGCPPGTDSNDCGFPAPWTMIYGSDFYDAHTTDAGAFTESDHCTLHGTTGAVCTISLGGSEANGQGATTTTLGPSDMTFLPVTITAGVEKLTAAATGAASPTATGSKTGSSGGTFT
jgi:hypothetical protein